MNHRVVHFEIPCDNPQKTMTFFEEVFGWQFQRFADEEYWLVMTGDENLPGINGGIMKKRDTKQPVVNSIDVIDIEAAIINIEKAGGSIVVSKMPIPTVGWIAYFKDPDGNTHGIYQYDPCAK
jgi:uncharacterized protein